MARPLRIAYADAWYHVMNRGSRKEPVFLEPKDYAGFVDLLGGSVELWNVRIAAYCLMPNHYHLLIQTPEANLSRCMRHINGVYTQRFNRFHQCDGQLFRGRYKAILVDADRYLLELVRYIHRNPLRAGIVEKLDAYSWSSHKGYLSSANKWNWLHKDFTLSMLTPEKKVQRRQYRQFVVKEASKDIREIYEKKKLPSVLGTEAFVDWVKETFFLRKRHKEVPESRLLAPDRGTIRQVVCRHYGVRQEDLERSRRGVFNEPRTVAIYLTRLLRKDTLAEICEAYELANYSSASSVIERANKRRASDRRFSERMERLSGLITKSQTKT